MDDKEITLTHEVISFARKHSYYYRQLYQSVPNDESSLKDLPFTNLGEYWELAKADLANVLTTPLAGGRIHCTDGPTSLETTHLTLDETHNLSKSKALIWGNLLDLSEGDRIASIGTSNELQVGFWDTVNMYTGVMIPARSIQILISSEQPVESIAAALARFRPNILIASPPDLTRLIEFLNTSNTLLLSVRAIIYLGHTLPKDLHESWNTAFPKAKLYPLLYSTLPLGPLGIPSPITTSEATSIDPTYTAAHEVAILEIVADDGTLITQPDIKGNVVITHLQRRLQPLIRYPINDTASWVDYPSRTFTYHGQLASHIQLASSTLNFSLVKRIVESALGTEVRGRFQCVLYCGPRLVIRLAFPMAPYPGQLRHNIEAGIWRAAPEWRYERLVGRILSVRLEWVDGGQLVRDGLGRVREVVDERWV